ncbi:hypothetical protein C0431_04365 [bacterium]|nr:hypothetical protein [bacterium]
MSLKHQPFDGTEATLNSPLVSDQELQAVLQSLQEESLAEETHKISPYDEWVTVAAICEATGHNEAEISALLHELRRQDLASKISTRLRELEAPLYSVERPGHHRPDPSAPLIRIEQINTILDRLLPKSEFIKKRSKSLEPTAAERTASLIATVFAVLILVGSVLLIFQALIR